MRKRDVRLYNVFFPVWFLLLYPLTWLAAIPINFGVDLLVVWLCFRHWKLPFREIWKREIWLCCLFGFLADIAGATLLLASHLIVENDWWYDNVVANVSWQPFGSIWAVGFILLCMAFSSLLIYLLDRFVVFRRRGRELSHKLALTLAIATTPITFLLPSAWIYGGGM